MLNIKSNQITPKATISLVLCFSLHHEIKPQFA